MTLFSRNQSLGTVFAGWLTAIVLAGWASIATAQSDLLITAPNDNTIERFDGFTGEYLGSFVSAGSGGLSRPGGVAVGPDGNVYVTSISTNRVLRYNGTTGAFVDVFAEGNGLNSPNNILFHNNQMFVGQFNSGGNGFVKRYDANTGAFIDNFLDVDFADGIEFVGDTVLVSNFFGGVNRFSLDDGAFIDEFIASGEGGLLNPTALLELANGDLLVSSYGTNEVKRYGIDGTYLGDAITGLARPEGLAIGLDGNLYAGSYALGIVNRYDIDTFAFQNEFANHGPVTNFFTFRGAAVPEPTATLMVGLVIAGIAARRRRKRILA
ncbi:MAG: PEP-CTERM sorting domain-containing protein [Planctomycetota bacterium]